MSVTVQTIINNVRVLLQDTDAGGIRWVDSELIAWLNEAAAEIVRIKPEASARNVDLTLVAGTRQRIPTDGVQLINVVRNVAANGAAGRVIRLIDHNILNNERPDWHSETQVPVVTRYTFDPKDPMTFYVYPPATTAARVTLVYSAAPTPVTALANPIPVSNVFVAQLVDYICYRAWLKQVGDPSSESRAAAYKNLFDNAMATRNAVESQVDPNARGMNGRI